jgi:hypothetical protein
MPEQQKAVSTRVAEALDARVKELAPRVAALMRPVLGNVTVSKDERHRRWWQEEKGWTREKEQALLASGMSREDVGLLKYPHREIDARAAGHGDVRKEAEYARDMTALGPPAPEPLEAAALALETEGEAGSPLQPSLGVEAVPPAPPTLPAALVAPNPPEGGY